MPEVSSPKQQPLSADRFQWSVVVGALTAAIVVVALIQISADWDLALVIYCIFIAPVIALGLAIATIVGAFRRRPRLALSFLSALLVFASLTWFQLKHSTEIHASMLWLVHAKTYKATVLAEQSNGSLKHMEWFGWGFAGSDSTMYIAFDPTNALGHRDSVTGEFGSLHCDVWQVRRLEDAWYAVTFYTNRVWDSTCDAAPPTVGLRP